MVNLNPSEKNSPTVLTLSIPAKAMLFGEYGVLAGGPAAVVLLDSYLMKVQFSLESAGHKSPSVCFESDFFETPLHVLCGDLSELINASDESEARNLACYLSGFSEFLKHNSLRANVLKSFSPDLGFGTSSALLVAFQFALATFAESIKSETDSLNAAYWQRLYQALLCLQKKGSGYDVAAQSWAALQSVSTHGRVVRVDHLGLHHGSFHPSITPLEIEKSQLRGFGCFVRTGVRSETRRVVQSTTNQQKNEFFYQQQKHWAESFLQSPTRVKVVELCKESSHWARRWGLLPDDSWVQDFTEACDAQNVAWKTMGAGQGDCLWVVAERNRVEDIIRTIKASQLSVAFDFAEGV